MWTTTEEETSRPEGDSPAGRDDGETFPTTLAAILAAREGEEVCRQGLRALAQMLGGGVRGCALVYDGADLRPAAALDCDWPSLRQLRVCPREAPWASGQVAAQERHGVSATLERLTEGLPAESRAGLLHALGASPQSAAILLPLADGEDTVGYLLAAWTANGHPLAERDLHCAQALAAVVTLALRQLGLRSRLHATGWLETEVIAAVSHQMRTPLAAIKGYATALLLQGDAYDAATRQEFLRVIDEETDRLASLISDVLESAAVGAGRLHLELQPVLLPQLAREVVERLARLSPAHRFVVSFQRRFPVLHADPGRLEQALHNLLDNAVKYSPEGGLVVVRGHIREAEVVVSVADQGVGIAPEHLNRLFERFYRIGGPGHRPVPGTGLGLPIARAIVEAHGGRIWAESSLGRGATFYFALPRQSSSGDHD